MFHPAQADRLQLHSVMTSAQSFVFDLDGCIYHGERPEEKAASFIRQLTDYGKQVLFLSNNSLLTGKEISDKLLRMGIEVHPESIVSVTDVAGDYLFDRFGNCRVKVFGSDALAFNIQKAGHRVIPWESEHCPDIVIIGRDLQFNFDKLSQILKDISTGARVIMGNPDMTHPGNGGFPVPETGLLAAGLERVTREPIAYIGKPGSYLYLWASQRFGIDMTRSVMVGDNLLTDIQGGHRLGMTTCWICLHDKLPSDLDDLSFQPDYTFSSFTQLSETIGALLT